MKWFSRLCIYKSSNCEFNPETQVGKSYGWWVVTTPYKGHVLFNNSFYSQSTVKHQSKIRSHVNPTICLYHTTECLSNPDNALRSEITALLAENKELLDKIAAPRTQKKKNAERVVQINANGTKILLLKETFDLDVEIDHSLMAFTKFQAVAMGLTEKVA